MASLLLLVLHQPKSYSTFIDASQLAISQARKLFSPRTTSIRCKASSSSAPSSPASIEQTQRAVPRKLLQEGHRDDDEVEYGDMEEAYDTEDPRPLREIWREIQGSEDWEGLLDPMNSHLRREIIRYGEFSQACYDSFDFDPHSKYCGSCKYLANDFFDKMHMSHCGYHMCRSKGG